jgi:hypothetical protein
MSSNGKRPSSRDSGNPSPSLPSNCGPQKSRGLPTADHLPKHSLTALNCNPQEGRIYNRQSASISKLLSTFGQQRGSPSTERRALWLRSRCCTQSRLSREPSRRRERCESRNWTLGLPFQEHATTRVERADLSAVTWKLSLKLNNKEGVLHMLSKLAALTLCPFDRRHHIWLHHVLDDKYHVSAPSIPKGPHLTDCAIAS